jgi:DNA-binding response OmpR family regulator
MKKILIVDDDKDILEVVSYILTSMGFNVKTHSNGFDVPDIVLHYCPDLILLDIHLPGNLGTEICKELKGLDFKLPIILFSANAEKERAISISFANDFIEKPFDIKDLLKTVNLHVN